MGDCVAFVAIVCDGISACVWRLRGERVRMNWL